MVSRSKAETELQRLQRKVNDAVDNEDRGVRVERLAQSCDEAITKWLSKLEQLFEFASKTENPSLVKTDLENSLAAVTTPNDAILKKARDYIDQYPNTDASSKPPTAKKTQPSKTSSYRQSRTSSQKQRYLLNAQQRKEEVEKQNEAAIRLPKQQPEIELETLQAEQEQLGLKTERLKNEQALRVEQLEDENRHYDTYAATN